MDDTTILIDECADRIMKLRFSSIPIAPGTFRPITDEERKIAVMEIIAKYVKKILILNK